jgi:hypothetical protein
LLNLFDFGEEAVTANVKAVPFVRLGTRQTSNYGRPFQDDRPNAASDRLACGCQTGWPRADDNERMLVAHKRPEHSSE